MEILIILALVAYIVFWFWVNPRCSDCGSRMWIKRAVSGNPSGLWVCSWCGRLSTRQNRARRRRR